MPVVSAVLLILSFPGFNLWPLAWVALVPLLVSLEKCKPSRAFLVSYLTGFLFFLGTIYWLIYVTLPGMIAVAAYLALYFGIFGLLLSSAYKFAFSPVRTDVGKYSLMLYIPAAWVVIEWLRSNLMTGFPWVLLGHSQAFGNLPVIQIADTSGAYGVGFIIVLVNAAIFLVLRAAAGKKKIPVIPIIVASLTLVVVLRYGYIRLNNIFTGEPMKVCVVQGNIPQNKKWDGDFCEDILKKYERLTALAAEERPDLIIWPETAVPGFMESDGALLSRVRSIAVSAGTPLLAGTPRETGGMTCFNSATLFSGEGAIIDTYDKMRLVPFGEYIPFRNKLSFVEKFAHNPIGDFTPGDDHTVFALSLRRALKSDGEGRKLTKKARFSPLICFEDIFPDLSRRRVAEGASILVNMTNDAWFMDSGAPYQHAQCSVFRAVENRTSVVRAANTGLSCFIDQNGRITGRVEAGGKDIFVEGYRSHEVILSRAASFYTRRGDVFAYACMIFVAVFLALALVTARKMRIRTG